MDLGRRSSLNSSKRSVAHSNRVANNSSSNRVANNSSSNRVANNSSSNRVANSSSNRVHLALRSPPANSLA